MMADFVLTLEENALKFLIRNFSDPKKIQETFGLSRTGLLREVGKVMEEGIAENFNRGVRGDWKIGVNADILLRRKMQAILSSRKARFTKPKGGGLIPRNRVFVSDEAEKNVKTAKSVVSLRSDEKVRLVVQDTTRPSDIHPFQIGELEYLSEGITFPKGRRVAGKNSKMLLIPVSNISGSKLKRKTGESRGKWMSRIGALKSQPGITILMRNQASVGRNTVPKRRFMFFSQKTLVELNKIILRGAGKAIREMSRIDPAQVRQVVSGR